MRIARCYTLVTQHYLPSVRFDSDSAVKTAPTHCLRRAPCLQCQSQFLRVQNLSLRLFYWQHRPRPQEAVRPVRPWPYHFFLKIKKSNQKHHRNTLGTLARICSVKKTNKYTSWQMQNEMLKVMALEVLKYVAAPHSSPFYSMKADETTDSSNREQVVICL